MYVFNGEEEAYGNNCHRLQGTGADYVGPCPLFREPDQKLSFPFTVILTCCIYLAHSPVSFYVSDSHRLI